MNITTPAGQRAKLLLTALIAAAVALAAAATISGAFASNQAEIALSKSQKKAIDKAAKKAAQKYAKSYAKKYAKAGPQGAAGANGAGPAYVAKQSGQVSILDSSHPGALHTVLTKTVPAGSYVVNASADVTFTSTSANQGADGRCRLYSGATEIDDSQANGMGFTVFLFATLWTDRIQTSGAVTVTSDTVLTLKCQDNTNTGAGTLSFNASNARINAVQVTSVN